jgi:hypothetical protein
MKERADEGIAIDRERFSPPKGPRDLLPKGWVEQNSCVAHEFMSFAKRACTLPSSPGQQTA